MLVAEVLMRDRGITQTDVARIGGVNRVTVNRILRGHLKPYPKYRKAFSDALKWDKNPEELFREIEGTVSR